MLAGLVAVAVAAVYGPGLLLGRLLRLRGLLWVALAPALTFGVAGVSGPLLRRAGLPYTPATFLLALAAFCVGGVLLTRFTNGVHEERGPRPRDPVATGALVAGLALAVVIGVLPVGQALGWRLDAISQSWDSPVHANLVAYIAREHVGDWSVMQNLQAGSGPAYYPVGLHLVEALVVQVTGQASPAVYNAFVLLTPAQLALSAAACAAWLRPGRVVTPVAAAVAAVLPALSLYYLLLTQPYSWGVALVGAFTALVLTVARTPSLPAVGALAVAGAGLFALQPAVVAGCGVLAVAWLLASAAPMRARVRVLAALVGAGLVALAMSLPALLAGSGALRSVAGFDNKLNWPVAEVLAVPLVWGMRGDAYWIVAVAVACGFVLALLRPRLRWVAVAHLAFVGLFVVAHLLRSRVGNLLTGVWYNDPARLQMLFGVTGALLVGIAVTALLDVAKRLSAPRLAWVAEAAVIVGLLALTMVTALRYVPRNEEPVAAAYGNGPSLTSQQEAVLDELPRWVGPGQHVLNDPWQGSVWMYAYSGVRPLVGRYGDPSAPASDLLLRNFQELDSNPAVQAAVIRQRVCAVYVGTGSVVPKDWQWPALSDLDAMPDLRRVHQDPQSRVYVLQGPLAAQARCGPAK